MKKLFFAFQMIKHNVFRSLVVFVLTTVLLWQIIYISTVANSYFVYNYAFESMWGSGNYFEVFLFSRDFSATELKKDIMSFPFVEKLCMRYGLFSNAEYKNVPIKIMLIDEDIWKDSSLIKWDNNFSENGLTDNVPQVIKCDPFQLMGEKEIDLIINGADLKVQQIAEIQSPYLFPNFNIGGNSVSVFERFEKDQTVLIMKLTESTLSLIQKYSAGSYSNIAFLKYKPNTTKEETDQIQYYFDSNNIVSDKIVWTSEDMIELRKNIFDSYFQLSLILFILLLIGTVTYFAFFYKENAVELSVLKITSCSNRQMRLWSSFVTLIPIISADLTGCILFFVFKAQGKVPFFNAERLIFSFPVFLLLSAILNCIYLLFAVLIINSILNRSDPIEIKRRNFV